MKVAGSHGNLNSNALCKLHLRGGGGSRQTELLSWLVIASYDQQQQHKHGHINMTEEDCAQTQTQTHPHRILQHRSNNCHQNSAAAMIHMIIELWADGWMCSRMGEDKDG